MKFNKYNDSYNIVSKNLKNIRENLNMSQEKLSNQLSLLGITLYQSDIFKIEHNERTVCDFELWGICSILKLRQKIYLKKMINK